jgi:hypothetical protein
MNEPYNCLFNDCESDDEDQKGNRLAERLPDERLSRIALTDAQCTSDQDGILPKRQP